MATKPVVAGTDGSQASLYAVGWAAREAMSRHTSLRILAVPALPPRMQSDTTRLDTVTGLVRQSTEDALSTAAEHAAQQARGLAVETELRHGSPAEVLADAGREALMLVVGSRGAGGFTALVLGSVSRYLATHTQCPVVVAREETRASSPEVVVGVGDPHHPVAALAFAFEEAAARNARLVAVHAWFWSFSRTRPEAALTDSERAALDPGHLSTEVAAQLDATLAEWRAKYPDVEAGWELVHAHPGRVLAGASARADLVVLGRHRGGPHPTIGSVTHAVLNHAHGPVATVPGD
jgi:nucleotide-binding universal stress UspA family protein